MHTVELLEEAIALAEKVGYQVREEWLGGSGGGPCQVKGRKWIFLDLATGPGEQLEQVLEALESEPAVDRLPASTRLRELLRSRQGPEARLLGGNRGGATA